MSASGSRQGKKSKKDSYVPERECTHAYCHRDTIDSDKPIGLPWASGRLKALPGDSPIVVCTGYEPEQKVRPKRKKKCECKQEVIKKRDPFEYCYPEYIDLCDTCLVNEELIFFLNLIAVGDSHYEKELERNKQADEEAEKERKECLKRKKEAGQETEDEEKEDEETEDEEEKDDEEKEDEEKKEEEKKEDEE